MKTVLGFSHTPLAYIDNIKNTYMEKYLGLHFHLKKSKNLGAIKWPVYEDHSKWNIL